MNMYDLETIQHQQQTKNRRMVDILAAILRVVIRGEGTRRGIENGANLSSVQVKHLLTKDQGKESIYKITQKAIRFLRLNEMIRYPRK